MTPSQSKARYFSFLFRFVLLAACLVPTLTHAEPAMDAVGLDDVTRGSLMLETQTPGRYRIAPNQQTDVDIRISGPIARAVVRQRFTNPGEQWAEALYAFPLPVDAAVDHMRMQVGERIIEGEIQEREQARKTYTRAKQNGQRAALIEQHRPNLFTTAVANIPPHGEIVVEIEYQQTLRWHDDAFSLRFPMAITPRYQPAEGRVQQQQTLAGGWRLLPDELPNAVDIRPAGDGKKDQRLLNPVNLQVTLDSGFALANITSPYHAIDDQVQGRVHRISLADGPVPADRDFMLKWRPQKGKHPRSAFFTETTERGDYGLLMLMPPKKAFAQQTKQPRETLYIIDTSGSMAGESIREARRSLLRALTRLKRGDYFNVIEFNNRPRALFNQPRPVNADSQARARQFVNGLDASGGTEMLPALNLAFAQRRSAPNALRQIVFITDGAVANEQALFTAIHKRLGTTRLFTVGIGSAPNSYFMTEAAHFGRGSFTQIGDVNEVDTKMDALLRRIEHPALTDLRLELPVRAMSFPNPLPDLYLGEPVSVVMKLSGKPEQARLSGRIGTLDWSTELNLGDGEQHSGLGVLWARTKIRSLLRTHRGGGDANDERDQVLQLALNHHLVSPYTSLVAVDKTPVRPADEPLAGHALKSNLPAGLSPTQTGQLAFAHGSTPSLLLLLLGSPLMLLGLAGNWIRRKGTRAQDTP